MKIEFIEGGITAAKGFIAGGVHCGIRKNRSKSDLALIYSADLCDAAAVYTTNLVKGAPILVTKEHLENGKARAMVCNSGNANTCNKDGVQKANLMCEYTAEALNIQASDVIVASTGVIGQPINVEPVKKAMPDLAASLSADGSEKAAEAIMTTDTAKKEFAVECEIGGKTVRIGGIAKGSGMIAPNMATMLCFLTTDAAITSELLHCALKYAAEKTFNMVSVDGDTSTNDMLSIMANGKAGNTRIEAKNEDYTRFDEALTALCIRFAKSIAKDGEGATRLLECNISGAKSTHDAAQMAKAVVNSNLVKAAFFGADANWGRILCAIGYSGADTNVEKIDVTLSSAVGEILVCKDGGSVDFDEEKAGCILHSDEIVISVNTKDGDACATAWGCDLTYDYVKINGDYRT